MRLHHVNQPTGTYSMYRNVNGEPDTCMSQLNQIIAATHLLDKISGVSSNVCKCQYFMEINGCTRAGKLLSWLVSMQLQLRQNTSYCSCGNIKRDKHYKLSTIWDIPHMHMKRQKKDWRGSSEASVGKS